MPSLRPSLRSPMLLLTLAVAVSACGSESSTSTAAPAAVSTNNDAEVRAAITRVAPGASIGAFQPAALAGFRELVIDGHIVYVSDDGKYLLQGALIDLGSGKNLTSTSEARLHKSLLDEVGAERRIVFAAAKPKHRVTVFTDVDCGYCRKLHSEIAAYNAAGITVEYLFYPRGGPNTPAYTTSVSVWCSDDRRQALTDAKNGAPLPALSCTNPVAEDFALGQRVGVMGTPAVFAEDGAQIGGYLPPAEMLASLDQHSAADLPPAGP